MSFQQVFIMNSSSLLVTTLPKYHQALECSGQYFVAGFHYSYFRQNRFLNDTEFIYKILFNIKRKPQITKCYLCSKDFSKPANLRKNLYRIHLGPPNLLRQQLLTNGKYSCLLHNKPILMKNAQHLKQHLFFCHRNDDPQILREKGYSHQLIHKECKRYPHTLFHYKTQKQIMQQY